MEEPKTSDCSCTRPGGAPRRRRGQRRKPKQQKQTGSRRRDERKTSHKSVTTTERGIDRTSDRKQLEVKEGAKRWRGPDVRQTHTSHVAVVDLPPSSLPMLLPSLLPPDPRFSLPCQDVGGVSRHSVSVSQKSAFPPPIS